MRVMKNGTDGGRLSVCMYMYMYVQLDAGSVVVK